MIVTLPLNCTHLRIVGVEPTVAIKIVIVTIIIAAAPHPSPIHLCPTLVLLPQITTLPILLPVTTDIIHQLRNPRREETRTKSLKQTLTQPSTYLTALTGKAVFFLSGILLWINSRIW
jgi:hypothetical protein